MKLHEMAEQAKDLRGRMDRAHADERDASLSLFEAAKEAALVSYEAIATNMPLSHQCPGVNRLRLPEYLTYGERGILIAGEMNPRRDNPSKSHGSWVGKAAWMLADGSLVEVIYGGSWEYGQLSPWVATSVRELPVEQFLRTYGVQTMLVSLEGLLRACLGGKMESNAQTSEARAESFRRALAALRYRPPAIIADEPVPSL